MHNHGLSIQRQTQRINKKVSPASCDCKKLFCVSSMLSSSPSSSLLLLLPVVQRVSLEDKSFQKNKYKIIVAPLQFQWIVNLNNRIGRRSPQYFAAHNYIISLSLRDSWISPAGTATLFHDTLSRYNTFLPRPHWYPLSFTQTINFSDSPCNAHSFRQSRNWPLLIKNEIFGARALVCHSIDSRSNKIYFSCGTWLHFRCDFRFATTFANIDRPTARIYLFSFPTYFWMKSNRIFK